MKIVRTYYSNKEHTYIPCVKMKTLNYYIKENNSYVPRFTIKQEDIIPEMPIDKKMPYNETLLKKAIENGMILKINYAGNEDNWKGGRERTIYPMVIGKSKDGNTLIRTWHLIGWSVSKGKVVEKEWRMLRADNIKSMTFTGGFYRLPPDGYKPNDKGIDNIIKYADFNIIRSNQEKLITKAKIQLASEVVLTDNIVYLINAENANYKLDLSKPFDSSYIEEKNASIIRLTFLKNVITDENIVLLGILGKINNKVKLFENGILKGTYVVIDTFMATDLKKKTLINNISVFDIYFYEGKK